MPPIANHRNRTIRVDNTQVIENALAQSFLAADSAAASGTLSLQNVEKFAVGKYVWINPFGETSEIVAVHASTAPSQPTLTLAANTVFAHSTGEPVYYIEFNQVEISIASTVGGSKSVLATVALQAGGRETVYLDTANSSGYYFARFKDSVAATFGSYCDAIAYGGYTASTVGYMIERALSELGITLSEKVSTEDCFTWVTACLSLIQGKLKRWPEHYTYNSIIGQITPGVVVVAMPTDAYDTETNKSILPGGLRVGNHQGLDYLTPAEFDEERGEANVTTTRSSTSAGATSLPLTNSYDFDDSGSVSIWVSGVLYTVTYTGVTRDTATGATGALTGVPASGTGSITVTIPSGTNVWQHEEHGQPTAFTVRNGNIEFLEVPDATLINQNIYLDYSHVITAVDSLGDVIDLQRYDMVLEYLTWRMKMKAQNNGVLDTNDGFYAAFKERLNDAIRTLANNNSFPMKPKLNRMRKR